MKLKLICLFATLFVLNCAKKNSDETKANSFELIGQWDGACIESQKSSFTFFEQTWIKSDITYYDSKCEIKSVTTNQMGTFSISEENSFENEMTNKKINFFTESVQKTAHLASTVESFNARQECNSDDWVKGEPKVLETENLFCGNSFKLKGHIFGVYNINGNELRFGRFQESIDSGAPNYNYYDVADYPFIKTEYRSKTSGAK